MNGHTFGGGESANGVPNGVKKGTSTGSDFDDTASDGTTENDLARRMMELTVEDDDADFFKSTKPEHACRYVEIAKTIFLRDGVDLEAVRGSLMRKKYQRSLIQKTCASSSFGGWFLQ